jgi:CHRD domain
MKNKIFLFAFIATIAMVSLVACRKEAEDNVITRSSLLEGSQEVPAVVSTGSGKVEYSYNRNTRNLTYVATWANLNDSAISMHIHGLGVRGQAAGVFQNFTLTTSQKRKEGTYTGTLIIDNTSIKEADLLAGKYYLNLHSKVNTGGELRAQLEF